MAETDFYGCQASRLRKASRADYAIGIFLGSAAAATGSLCWLSPAFRWVLCALVVAGLGWTSVDSFRTGRVNARSAARARRRHKEEIVRYVLES